MPTLSYIQYHRHDLPRAGHKCHAQRLLPTCHRTRTTGLSALRLVHLVSFDFPNHTKRTRDLKNHVLNTGMLYLRHSFAAEGRLLAPIFLARWRVYNGRATFNTTRLKSMCKAHNLYLVLVWCMPNHTTSAPPVRQFIRIQHPKLRSMSAPSICGFPTPDIWK